MRTIWAPLKQVTQRGELDAGDEFIMQKVVREQGRLCFDVLILSHNSLDVKSQLQSLTIIKTYIYAILL